MSDDAGALPNGSQATDSPLAGSLPVDTQFMIRIVYDGAPGSGRRTNIEQLLSLLSGLGQGRVVAAPGAAPRSFVWHDFADAEVAGRTLSCEVRSTAGHLGTDWSGLVGSADAVVFVVDSRLTAVESARASMKRLRGHLESLGGETPLLLQANKQDLGDAVPSAEVARLLSVGFRHFGAKASVGQGVTDTFLAALRLALRSVRARSRKAPPPGPETAIEARPPQALAPARLPGDIPGGGVWPPHTRSWVREVCSRSAERASTPRPWAPDASVELRSGPWVLHSFDGRFTELADARRALAEAVHRGLGWWLPPRRGFFIAEDDGSWLLWMITDDETTVDEEFRRALEHESLVELEDALLHWLEVEAALCSRPSPLLTLGSVYVAADHVACLEHGVAPQQGSGAELASEVSRLLNSAMERSPRLVRAAVVGAQKRAPSASDARRLHLLMTDDSD